MGENRQAAAGGVLQTDLVREPRVRTFLVVPLISRLHLEGLPGDVRLQRRAAGLTKPSAGNVYDVQNDIEVDDDTEQEPNPAE